MKKEFLDKRAMGKECSRFTDTFINYNIFREEATSASFGFHAGSNWNTECTLVL